MIALGLCVVFGFAFTWLFILIGLVAGSAQAAQGMSLLVFPLTFVSSAYVPVDSMPGWLQWFAEHQPITAMVDAVRAWVVADPVATFGESAGALTVKALLWSAGLVAGLRARWRSPATAGPESIRVFDPIRVLDLDFPGLRHSDGRKHSDVSVRSDPAAGRAFEPDVDLAGADRVLVVAVADAGGDALPPADRADHHQVVPEHRLGLVAEELGHRVDDPGVIAGLQPGQRARGRPRGPPACGCAPGRRTRAPGAP